MEGESKSNLLWKKLPLKYKLIIIGVIAGFISILLFLVVLITPLMNLGIINIEGIAISSDGYSYSSILGSINYWWPIGSAEPTDNSGKIYAGEPSYTVITSEFGPRIGPITGIASTHTGIDIADGKEPGTTNVIAAKEGTVIYPHSNSVVNCPTSSSLDDCGGGYGNYVMIQHSNGIVTLYGHLYENSITVKEGDKVVQGQLIGKMGSSGNSTGTHLHFEVIENGTKINPLNYVSIDKTRPADKYNLEGLDGEYGSAEENKSAMCKILINAGFSNNAVAGILVNVSHEGGFRTNNMEDCYEFNQCCNFGSDYGLCTKSSDDPLRKIASDELYTAAIDSGQYTGDNFSKDSVGYGLVQWTSSGRKRGLYEASKNKGVSIANLGLQVNYLFEELSGGSYLDTMEAITDETASASDIATAFCLDFERPYNGEVTCPNRALLEAESYLNYVKNGCQ